MSARISLGPADDIVQLLFVSFILLCPSDFSSLYKARTRITVEFHPEKEIPISKGIAQQPATVVTLTAMTVKLQSELQTS